MATTTAAVLAVTLGAYVRSSGSGLGCPDWPRCHGSWIPPLEAAALIEYSHRLAVTLLGGLGLVVVATIWFKYRAIKSIFRPAMLAVLVVAVQAWVGRLVVLHELPANLVALHFFIALSLIAVLAVMTVNSFLPRGGGWDGTARLALSTATVVFAALMAGALVSQTGSALVFRDWPLMDGRLVPDFRTTEAAVHFVHRMMALIAGTALIYSAVRIRSRAPKSRPVAFFGKAAVVIWTLQVAAGAANIFFRSAEWTVVVHVLLASLLWAVVVGLVSVSYRLADIREGEREPVPGSSSSRSWAGQVHAYIRLTKPRIIELLLITTVPIMIVAEGGLPSFWLVLATLVGGSFAAGSANAINCYLERDIDELMRRTAARPLPRGEIIPSSALRFGLVLGGLGILVLAVAVNLLSAVLALAAIMFYVVVYTVLLKRTTPSNIVIGGAAGAAPVLIGWAAVTGRLELPAIAAFLIVFYWTPPHFWALSMRYASDYRAAGVPMLPVVVGARVTGRRILIYALSLVGVSLLFVPVARTGPIYLAAALVLGVTFVGLAVRLSRTPEPREAMSLFRFSIAYLTLLFVAMGADRLFGEISLEGLYSPTLAIAALVFAVSQASLAISLVRARRARADLVPA